MLVRLGELLGDFPGAKCTYKSVDNALTGSVTYLCDNPSAFNLTEKMLRLSGLESLIPIECFTKQKPVTVSRADFFEPTPKTVEFSFTIPLSPELEAYLSKPFLIWPGQILVNGHTDKQALSLFNPSQHVTRTYCCITKDPFALDAFRHVLATLSEGECAAEDKSLIFEKNGETLSVIFEDLKLNINEGKTDAYRGNGQVFNPFLIFYIDEDKNSKELSQQTKEKMMLALDRLNKEILKLLKPVSEEVCQSYRQRFVYGL